MREEKASLVAQTVNNLPANHKAITGRIRMPKCRDAMLGCCIVEGPWLPARCSQQEGLR